MSFCWENGYHGILSDDGEFALYNPPKYFSAHELKLSFQVNILILQTLLLKNDLNSFERKRIKYGESVFETIFGIVSDHL